MEEKSVLFTEVSLEESAMVQGGATKVDFDWNTYFYILGSAYAIFGKNGVTQNMIEFAWESSFSFSNDQSEIHKVGTGRSFSSRNPKKI